MNDRKNELEKLSDAFAEGKKKIIKDEMDIIHQAIVTDTKAKMPESVFVSNFLEPFKNLSSLENDNLAVKQWILISGSPYAQVDIIDGKGNVVHTTPSLIARPVILEEKMNNIDFKDVSINFINKTNHVVASGVNYLKTELSVVEQNITANTDASIKQWEHITTYYTKKSDNATGLKEPSKVSSKITDIVGDNDLDYS